VVVVLGSACLLSSIGRNKISSMDPNYESENVWLATHLSTGNSLGTSERDKHQAVFVHIPIMGVYAQICTV